MGGPSSRIRSSDFRRSENAANTHTKHTKPWFYWKLSHYTLVQGLQDWGTKGSSKGRTYLQNCLTRCHKSIYHCLEIKTFFGNSIPATGPSTESSTQKPRLPTNSRQWHHRKRDRKNLHTKKLQSNAWVTTLSKTDPSGSSGHTSRHAKTSSNKDS
jgi:hypothetical protein